LVKPATALSVIHKAPARAIVRGSPKRKARVSLALLKRGPCDPLKETRAAHQGGPHVLVRQPRGFVGAHHMGTLGVGERSARAHPRAVGIQQSVRVGANAQHQGPRMSVTPSRAWLARSASGPQAGGGILDAGCRRKRLGRPFTRRVSTAVRAPLCSASNRSPRASRSRRHPRGWSRGVCATGDLQPARCR